MSSIVVVGSLNADLVVRSERAPEAGETVSGIDFQTFAGGKGANQAAAVGRLGHRVALIGAVGQDSFGTMLRAELEAASVALDGVATEEGSTGVALIVTEKSGENRIVVVAGANGRVTPQMVEQQAEAIRSAALLMLQLELPMDAVQRAAAIAHGAGVTVVLDPAPAVLLPVGLLRQVTWLTPNRTEAGVLLGQPLQGGTASEMLAAAERLLALGPQNILLKLGAEGCAIAMSNGLRLHVPAFRVDAVDTTAAGDAFNAGLCVALLENPDVIHAAQFAAAVAAISVTRHGAIPSMPARAEVEAFLQKEVTSG